LAFHFVSSGTGEGSNSLLETSKEWSCCGCGAATTAHQSRVRCTVCDREETILHRCWECPHSAWVWDFLRNKTSLSLPAPSGIFISHKDLLGWFLDWLGSLDEVELATVMMALCQLWLARNNARDCPMIEDPDDIA
jgi:hypothetical protein